MHTIVHAAKVNQTLVKCLEVSGNGLDSDEVINRLLAILGQHYDGDRAFVFEFARGSEVINYAYEWCREGFESQLDELEGMHSVDFGAWVDALGDEPAVFIDSNHIEGVPHADEQIAILDGWGLSSILVAPLRVDGRLAGFLTVDNARNIDDIFIVLRSVAATIAEDIGRRESLGSRIVSAIRSIYVGLYMWNLEDKTYEEIENGLPTWRSTNQCGSLDDTEDAIRKTVDAAYQDSVREFVNVDRIRRDLRERNDDSIQYPARDIGWVLGRLVVMERDSNDVPTRVIFLVEDIDKSKCQMELASYKAEHDALTGLLNRAALNSSVGDVAKDTRPVAVLIMDVDAFKSVNDHFGHGVGDRVLSGVAQAISSSMRSSDLVYRYGGDEFVAIARNCPVSSEPELIHRVSMINRSLEGRFAEVPSLTLSAGIAFGPGGADGEELLSHADKALYRAKRTPVKCCVYDPEVDK